MLQALRFWPVRRYPWGTCQVQLSSHSDMGALKRLLFESAFEELKAVTEARYYAAREAAIAVPPAGSAPVVDRDAQSR